MGHIHTKPVHADSHETWRVPTGKKERRQHLAQSLFAIAANLAVFRNDPSGKHWDIRYQMLINNIKGRVESRRAATRKSNEHGQNRDSQQGQSKIQRAGGTAGHYKKMKKLGWAMQVTLHRPKGHSKTCKLRTRPCALGTGIVVH